MAIGTKKWKVCCADGPWPYNNDFKIVYRKGSSNSNADALSRLPPESCAVTIGLPHYSPTELHASQSNDDTLSAVHQARLSSPDTPQTTKME